MAKFSINGIISIVQKTMGSVPLNDVSFDVDAGVLVCWIHCSSPKQATAANCKLFQKALDESFGAGVFTVKATERLP